MTTPSDESAARPAEPSAAEAVPPAEATTASPDAPTAATPAATVIPEAAPPPHAFGPPPGYAAYPYPDPAFAPVARAPRVPWVNPARRVRVAAVAAAAGLVLLGGGLVTGFAVGHHADRGERFGNVRIMPGRMLPDQGLPGMPGNRGGQDGPWMRMGPGGNGQLPPGMPGPRNYPGYQAPSTPATPSPSPSTSR